jgi:hypothetical protein
MAIHPVDGGFVISSGHTWLPGLYESERAARYAFKFPDETLSSLRNSKNVKEGATITFNDLQAAKATLRSPRE